MKYLTCASRHPVPLGRLGSAAGCGRGPAEAAPPWTTSTLRHHPASGLLSHLPAAAPPTEFLSRPKLESVEKGGEIRFPMDFEVNELRQVAKVVVPKHSGRTQCPAAATNNQCRPSSTQHPAVDVVLANLYFTHAVYLHLCNVLFQFH